MRVNLSATHVAKFYGLGWSWAWFMATKTFAINFTLWSKSSPNHRVKPNLALPLSFTIHSLIIAYFLYKSNKGCVIFRSFHGFTDEVDNQFMKDNVCYLSFVMKLLKQHKRTNELDNFKQELKMVIDAATAADDEFDIPYDIPEFNALQQMFSRQSMRSCSVCKLIRVPIQLAWNLDRQMIVDFHQTTETRYANIPNLDGFYGGEACKRTWSDQSKNILIREGFIF